jgi:hypothetical protein
VVLGFEFRALLGRCCATYAVPSPFALVIFGIGAHAFAQASLQHGPPIYASCVAGMTGLLHGAQL